MSVHPGLAGGRRTTTGVLGKTRVVRLCGKTHRGGLIKRNSRWSPFGFAPRPRDKAERKVRSNGQKTDVYQFEPRQMSHRCGRAGFDLFAYETIACAMSNFLPLS